MTKQKEVTQFCLSFYEEMMDKDIEKANFESAKLWYESLTGALWLAKNLELISEVEEDTRRKTAYRRWENARFPKSQEE
jgi:hypothetical protein